MMLSSAAAFGAIKADFDNSGKIELQDAVIGLQVAAGLRNAADLSYTGDIGLPEVIYVLRVLAGLDEATKPNTPLILPAQTFAQSDVSTSYNPQTGNLNFLSSEPGYAIAPSTPFASTTTAEEAARFYLSAQNQGSFFGLTDQAQELATLKVKTTDEKRNIVRFQQKYNGIPVIGAELVVQMDAALNLMSVSGEIIGGMAVSTTPDITADAARQTALAKIAEIHQKSISELTATTPELRIYNPILLGLSEVSENILVWKTEVGISNLEPIYEFVLVNAHTGNVVIDFNQVDTSRQRMTYNANNKWSVPGTLCKSEDGVNAGDAQCNAVHDYAGDTYNFYYNIHGRDSLDNAGMPIISNVHVGTDYCGAYWHPLYKQFFYGDGCFIITDDVIGHEMTHGVTQHESGLIYASQSGAINESFSDI